MFRCRHLRSTGNDTRSEWFRVNDICCCPFSLLKAVQSLKRSDSCPDREAEMNRISLWNINQSRSFDLVLYSLVLGCWMKKLNYKQKLTVKLKNLKIRLELIIFKIWMVFINTIEAHQFLKHWYRQCIFVRVVTKKPNSFYHKVHSLFSHIISIHLSFAWYSSNSYVANQLQAIYH